MKGEKASQNVIQIIMYVGHGEFQSRIMLMSARRSQPYCTTCHRGLFQSGGTIVLKACEKCQLVFTCTNCPSSHTTEDCKIWQRFGDVEIFRISFFNETVSILPPSIGDSLTPSRAASHPRIQPAPQEKPTKPCQRPEAGETSISRSPTNRKLSVPT